MRRLFLLLGAAHLAASCAGAGERRIAELERRLQEREREVAELRGQQNGAAWKPVASAREERPADDEGEMTRALERALVREGGLVLPPWAVQVEPELSYTYSEPGGPRRDTFAASATLRVGLPWTTQAEVFVPYLVHDHQSGAGSSSSLGDINLGLTKRLLREGDHVPELLLTGRWKTRTGEARRLLPTGTGAHAFQASLTAVKTHDPLVFYGAASYTEHLRSSRGVDFGDTLGVKVGAILAATPDTSVLVSVDVNSSFATRVGGFEIVESDRLSGILELGLATVLSRDTFLNVTAGIGFTEVAPDFRLAASVPTTRYR